MRGGSSTTCRTRTRPRTGSGRRSPSIILLWGNWFLEKLRGEDGLVNELRCIHPAQVEVQFNEVAGCETVSGHHARTARREMFSDDRILHGFGLSKDGLVGMSRITQARESLGVAKARTAVRGGRVRAEARMCPGVIQHPAPDQRQRRQAQGVVAGDLRVGWQGPARGSGAGGGRNVQPGDGPVGGHAVRRVAAAVEDGDRGAVQDSRPAYLGGVNRRIRSTYADRGGQQDPAGHPGDRPGSELDRAVPLA